MVSATSVLFTVAVFAMMISITETQLFDLCTILTAFYRVIFACPGSGNGLCDLIHFLFHAINCPERRLVGDGNHSLNLLKFDMDTGDEVNGILSEILKQ